MPDISPDFSAPGTSGFTQILSWALGISLLVTFLALVLCFAALAFKGFGNQNIQTAASKSVLWVAVGVTALGGISGIFQFLVGFDWGI